MRRYLTGSWFALARASAVALVPPAVPVDALEGIGDALDEGGIGAFLEALARATGSSVTSLPDFGAAVIHSDGMRVAVRGSVSASDRATDGGPVSGAGVTGWAEVVWSPTADAVLTVGEVGSATGAVELWIGTGVVLASAVCVSEGNHPASPLTARTSVATRQIPAVAAEAPPVGVSPVVVPPVVVPPVVVPPVVAAETVVSQPPQPVSEATHGAQEPTAVLADSGETIATPVDEADLVGLDDGDDGFGIWGSTIAAPPAAAPLIDAVPAASDLAALRPRPDQPVPHAAPAPETPPELSPVVGTPNAPGDHDGATISVAALRAMQASSAPPTFASVEDLARERRGRAVVSTGAVVTLDKNVIVGRTPRATRITGEMPHLVAVPSPQQDISRNHLEIRVTDTVVVAVDLDTTNGSVLHRPGAEPMRLHPGEVTVVVSNDVIDLGDGVTITFEDLP